MANDGVIVPGRTEVQRLQQLELQFVTADPGRALVLRCVWNWRKNWQDLAETLQRVAKDGAWRGWGFASFDIYCRDELGLKPSEVHALISALQFVKLELGSEGCAVPAVSLPAVKVAMAATEAAQAGQVDPELAKEIKDAVLSGQPIAPLKRQLKAQIETAKDEGRRPDEAKREALQKTLRTAAQLAEHLQDLADARSSEIAGSDQADELEALIERMRMDLQLLQKKLSQPAAAASVSAAAPAAGPAEPAGEPFKRVLFPESAEESEAPTAPTPDPEAEKRRASLSAWAKKYGALHGIKLRVPYGVDDHSLRALSMSCPVDLTTLPETELIWAHEEYERWFWAAKRKAEPTAKPRRGGEATKSDRKAASVPGPAKKPGTQAAPVAKAPARKPAQTALFETSGSKR